MCKSYPGCWAAVSGHASFLPCYGTQAESETSAHELQVLPHLGSWLGNRTLLDKQFVSSRAKVSDVGYHKYHIVPTAPKYPEREKHSCTTLTDKDRQCAASNPIQTCTKYGMAIVFCLYFDFLESGLYYLCKCSACIMLGNSFNLFNHLWSTNATVRTFNMHFV